MFLNKEKSCDRLSNKAETQIPNICYSFGDYTIRILNGTTKYLPEYQLCILKCQFKSKLPYKVLSMAGYYQQP